jgi:hypothetical protein
MYHLIFPFLGTVFYLNMRRFYFHVSPIMLNYAAFLHNILLVVFSGYTFIAISSILIEKGIVYQSGYYFSDSRFDAIIFYFYISKYYEYIDTYLILLKNKTPGFLQKYHHCGAVICWHLCYVYKVDCIWMASWINSFIHTIMYSYYAMSILKLEFIQRYKKYITKLQIVQLVAANIVSPTMYYPPVESRFNYSIVIFFNIYVVFLIALFINFSNKTYKTE